MKLTPGSEAYETWLNAPAPVYINFYFFNVTNAQQFIDKSVAPNVSQIGPYVYREIRNKTDIELINAGATLRYRQQKLFVFDANKSHGSENDVLTTVNIPLVVSQLSLPLIRQPDIRRDCLKLCCCTFFFLSFFAVTQHSAAAQSTAVKLCIGGSVVGEAPTICPQSLPAIILPPLP